MSSSETSSTEYSDSSSESDDHESCCGQSCDGCSNCCEDETSSTQSNIPGCCPYWEYCWSEVPLTGSYSATLSPSFIQLPQHIKAIRLGVRSSLAPLGSKKINIYCYLNHLEKQMGWVIQTATCFYEPDKFVELKTVGADVHGGELLVASITDRPKDEAAITLKFRFYLTGSTSFYFYHLCDMQLGAQLWGAAVNQQMTDVVFLVGHRSFAAHKFLLAARSPVFAAMFDTDMVESRTGRVKVDYVDPDTFQQFLRFLYTGQLDEPASQELAIIADKYDVQTLTAICDSAEFSFDADADDLFVSVRSATLADDSSGPRVPPLNPDELMAARFWEYEDVTSVTSVAPSAVCEEGGHSLMASMLIRSGSDYCHRHNLHSFRGKFLKPDQICLSSGGAGQDASRIVEVFWSSNNCIMDVFKEHQRYFTRMTPLNDPPGSMDAAEPAIQNFTARALPYDRMRIVENVDVPVEFHVCHSPSIPEFRYAFRDWRLSSNLWSSYVNKDWTDVDFLVGDKTFSAHRALLAARCPALIPPNFSVPMKIENVEASVFEELLFFVYTGKLKTFPPSEALYEAALTYQVGLLQRLFEINLMKKLAAMLTSFSDELIS